MLLEGYNLLMMAAETGDLEMLHRGLRSESVDQVNHNGNCALILAIKNQRFQVAELLLQNKANVNAKNNVRYTQAVQSALALACWQCWEEGVCLLIHHGADVNLCDKQGWSPLIIAAYKNQLNIVNILLGHGADTKHRNNYGKKAADKTTSQQIVQALMGYEIDGRVDKVKTALNMSEKKDRNEGKGDIYEYYDEIWEGVSKHELGDHSHDFITREHNQPPKIKTNWRENWTLESEYSVKKVQSKPSTPAHKPPAYKPNESRQRMKRISSDLNLKPTLPSQTTSPKMNNFISSYLSPQAGSKPKISSDKSSNTASLNNTIISSKSGSTAFKAKIKPAKSDQGKFDNKAEIILYMDQKVTKAKKTMVDCMNQKVNTELTEQISKLEKFFTKKVERSLISMNESIAKSFSSIYEIVLNDIAKIYTGETKSKHYATQEKREEAQLEIVKPTEKKARSSSLQSNNTQKPSHHRTLNKPKKVLITLDTKNEKSDTGIAVIKDTPIRPRLKSKSRKIDYREDQVSVQTAKEKSPMIKQGEIELSYPLAKIIELPQEMAQQSQESDIELEPQQYDIELEPQQYDIKLEPHQYDIKLEPQQPDALEKPREVPKPHAVVPRLNLSLI